MRPIEVSPDRWGAHPSTIGYGVAVGLGVVVVLLFVVGIGRLLRRPKGFQKQGLPELIAAPLGWIGFLAEPAASRLREAHERDAPGYDLARQSLVLSSHVEDWFTREPTWKQVFAAALFLKLRDDFAATVLLLRAGLVRSAEATSRVMLEANLKLAWLEQDADEAINRIAKDHYRSARIALERLRDYKLFENEEDEGQVLARIAELAPLAERFPRIEDLCRRLKVERVYDTMYRGTSAAVHTGLLTIDERIERSADDTISGFRQGPDCEQQATTLEAASVQFIIALGLLSRILGVDLDRELTSLSDQLRATALT